MSDRVFFPAAAAVALAMIALALVFPQGKKAPPAAQPVATAPAK